MGIQSVIFGEQAESIAALYLKKKGYSLLARNWRCKYGEIDLVGFQPLEHLTFFEVKFRSSLKNGRPVISISPPKLAKIKKAIRVYLMEHDLYRCTWQLDGLCLYYKGGRLRLHHYTHLFTDC